MQIKRIPADFIVQEQLDVGLNRSGSHAIYRVEKQGLTTAQVQTRMAAALGYAPSAIHFPARKDRQAVATQFASVRGNPPARLQGNGWEASHAGRLDRPLRPTDVAGNQFSLTLRELTQAEALQISTHMQEMVQNGLINYFDSQRFGSYSRAMGFIGAHILARDPEQALRAHLAQPYPGDPAPVVKFKRVAAANWADWGRLFEAAPRPSNYRSLLTYLRDHPQGYRKALNLIPRQLLSLYLSAYQSYLWNRIAGLYVSAGAKSGTQDAAVLEIAGASLPVYRMLDKPGEQSIVMPHHRAIYHPPELAAAAETVLHAEGLTLKDLKARILDRAYLSHHRRPLLLFPSELSLQAPAPDDRSPGWQKLALGFTLPRGSYATLVIKWADALTQITNREDLHDRPE